eukprot:7099050-Pyramimonas_sp.AAC.1
MATQAAHPPRTPQSPGGTCAGGFTPVPRDESAAAQAQEDRAVPAEQQRGGGERHCVHGEGAGQEGGGGAEHARADGEQEQQDGGHSHPQHLPGGVVEVGLVVKG